MAANNLQLDSFWVDKSKYDDAERQYYEKLANASLTPLADEVAKARQRLIEIRGTIDPIMGSAIDAESISFIKDMFVTINKTVSHLQSELSKFEQRLAAVEKNSGVITKAVAPKPTNIKVEDDDVDLFGSDSEDDAEAERVKTERVAAYAAKKSNKPVLIAKSSILLDVKVWDDETDMKAMEVEVRKIAMDGLLWGASKLVPLAYGIHKLQINCIVEDEKVSIDALQEQIEALEDFVQSVDIAAFNKI